MYRILIFGALMLNMVLPAAAQTAIPFVLTEEGHILVKAKVEGVEGNFIFDTGGGHNLFFKHFAQKLRGKETHHFYVAHRATGEAVKVPIYRSGMIQVGDSHFYNDVYSTFDLDIAGIDGILSLQMFREKLITIDYENKRLSLGPVAAGLPGNYIDIQLADDRGMALDIFTNVKLNDTLRIQVMLDSGAGSGSFWFNDRFIEELELNKAKFELTEKKSAFNPEKISKIYQGGLASISTAGGLARVEQPNVRFVEGLIYEGKTSLDWLGNKISISIPEKRIYILKAD